MNSIELLNTIRDNASKTYQERVPEATKNNLEEVGSAITNMDDAIVYNEFVNTLTNQIFRPYIISKSWQNPLGKFKKGKKTFGDTVEEIYNNFIKAKTYDQTGKGLLERNLPDTKTVFHRMNRQDVYQVSISPENLLKAFTSEDKLNSYLMNALSSMMNSSEYDEYVLMRELFKTAYNNNALVVVPVEDPFKSKENSDKFIKTVKTISGDMKFPKGAYNSYLKVQNKDKKEIVTFSKPEEQIFIVDNSTNVSVAVDSLAVAFNKSVLDWNTSQKEVIDAFPVKGMIAALVDKNFFQVYDDLFTFREFENGLGLYKNHYLHVWQTIGYSVLCNAVAFVIAEDKNSDGDISDTFKVTYTLKDGVKSANKNTSVLEGSSFETVLKGSKGSTVVITMKGNTLSNVYDTETEIVSIDKVTGDIVITVS
nr:MAG TPA: Head protein [Caudoviricetes sp.]